MLLGEYIFKESPKRIEVVCSKCGAKELRKNKSTIIKFVCHTCKMDRNRKRTRERYLEGLKTNQE
jgi:transposase-like protein